jgi:hypothetical protein
MTSIHTEYGLFPGHTIYENTDIIQNPIRYDSSLKNPNKPVILLTSFTIDDTQIFINGLYQNIILLYKLLLMLNYNVYIITDKKNIKNDKVTHRELLNLQLIDADSINEWISTYNLSINFLIEVGMHVPSEFRKTLQQTGCKVIQLFFGNILNIDIEYSQNILQKTITHHIFGNVDEVWMSPHYKMNMEYTKALYNCNTARIAPYLWDSCFVNNCPLWKAPLDNNNTDIIILEPNISIQKSFLIGTLLCEAFNQKMNGKWKGKLHIYNTDTFEYNFHVCENVLPMLDLYKENRIVMYKRHTIKEIIESHPSAVFICNQLNNDLNYMILELMNREFPVLHNSKFWKEFGYAYDHSNFDNSISILESAVFNHTKNLQKYKHDAYILQWKYSIYNPDNVDGWAKLLSHVE